MKLKELKKIYKYNETSEKLILDVQLEDYRDAYSDWDFSPFLNRDLDEDLTEYLMECSMEIPFKYDIVIRFHILNQEKSISREERSINGMINYFEYNARKSKNHRLRLFRDSFSFLVVGSILFLVGALIDSEIIGSLFLNLLVEGFYIGGWVMLWEMFSALFFDTKKITTQIKHYERLKNTEIEYYY